MNELIQYSTGTGVILFLLIVVQPLQCIILSQLIAGTKGHGRDGAWFWGLLFGWWAVIYYCAIPVRK